MWHGTRRWPRPAARPRGKEWVSPEPRNGSACREAPCPTKPAPCWSQGDEWVHGHAILRPSSGLDRQHPQSILPVLGFPKAVVISLPLHRFPFLCF